ncbi:hypothetical protein [Deinococcus apachensis]|uniref:hypothetical protein n=1 Tax=Deinococcus apachensis TaxID=309886 RepID=UPI0012FA82C4|nr:hypothetical protein [Deinococcus apachensis]
MRGAGVLGLQRTWHVPLSIRGDGGAELTFDGLRDQQHAQNYVTPGMGARWVADSGGQITLEQ